MTDQTTETKHMPSERETFARWLLAWAYKTNNRGPVDWDNSHRDFQKRWLNYADEILTKVDALTAGSQSRAPDQSERVKEPEAELAKAKADLATYGKDTEDTENRIIDAEFSAHDMKQRAEKAEAALAEARKVVERLLRAINRRDATFVSDDPIAINQAIGMMGDAIGDANGWLTRNPESSNAK